MNESEQDILLNNFIKNVKLFEKNEKDIDELEGEFLGQEEWDRFVFEYGDIPREISMKYLVKKNDLEVEYGINFINLLQTQRYSDDFYDNPDIIDLLNMSEREYAFAFTSKYPNTETELDYGLLWDNLFMFNQFAFSEDFIMKHAENLLDNVTLQIYQNIPIEFYDKYIDRLRYIDFAHQDIPVWFIKKYIKKYYKKMIFHHIICTQNSKLSEKDFIEIKNYEELSGKREQEFLWLTVGGYHISEKYIRDNLDKINRKYRVYNGLWEHLDYIGESDEDDVKKCKMISPWKIILQNGIKYSDELLEENLEYIGWDNIFCYAKELTRVYNTYLFSTPCYKREINFLKKYWDEIVEESKNEIDQHIWYGLCNQVNLSKMDDFIELQIKEGKLIKYEYDTSLLSNESESISEYDSFEVDPGMKELSEMSVSMNIVEKYREKLDLVKVLENNCQITYRDFRDKFLVWCPDICIEPVKFMEIDPSENSVLFLLNSYIIKGICDQYSVDSLYYTIGKIIQIESDIYSSNVIDAIKKSMENRNLHSDKFNRYIEHYKISNPGVNDIIRFIENIIYYEHGGEEFRRIMDIYRHDEIIPIYKKLLQLIDKETMLIKVIINNIIRR